MDIVDIYLIGYITVFLLGANLVAFDELVNDDKARGYALMLLGFLWPVAVLALPGFLIGYWIRKRS